MKISLVAALVLVALGGTACWDENILDPMADRQKRAMRYKHSDFYDDGLSMRAPPEGTVPRERITLNPRLTTGREPDGPIQSNAEPLPNYVKTIPIPVSRKLLETGRKRYDITCGTCHGPLGDGESIVARQMSLHPPPSLHKYVDKPAGYIFEVATKGFGMMASYAAELTVEERWAVVAYVRALQLSQLQPVSELPGDVRHVIEALPPGVNDPPPPAAPEGEGHHGSHPATHEEKR
jgi:mono/diheme cytochrome c family protein